VAEDTARSSGSFRFAPYQKIELIAAFTLSRVSVWFCFGRIAIAALVEKIARNLFDESFLRTIEKNVT
jgi:hypothetical protein